LKIIKKAEIEASSLVDPFSNKNIGVSTTARIAIRMNSEYKKENPMSNQTLNEWIAGIFKYCGTDENILHYFLAKGSSNNNPEWIEVRLANHPDMSRYGIKYFFSIRREDTIDIINLSSGFKKPNKARKIKFK
tara:strand:- start:772 stop:1170 length:399 start_codon:yes stop_codon:yes gene_type:complete